MWSELGSVGDLTELDFGEFLRLLIFLLPDPRRRFYPFFDLLFSDIQDFKKVTLNCDPICMGPKRRWIMQIHAPHPLGMVLHTIYINTFSKGLVLLLMP